MPATAVSITSLETILQREVADYARTTGLLSSLHYIEDLARKTYLVMVVPDHDHPAPFPARAVVMAQIVDEYVVIDSDTTDRPLVDELVRAGVPRERIVLYYAGETLPETSEP
jgi:hypothetical protein